MKRRRLVIDSCLVWTSADGFRWLLPLDQKEKAADRIRTYHASQE